ncbi:MAG TPA: serine/threonine-protein kinase [Oligoflexia bacterium]|nr:serine/threonine-protein kinase [Oligoflexia bacterium]HMP48070.1 serine/threonine-protein kinase [Oligoflexia bacterium]
MSNQPSTPLNSGNVVFNRFHILSHLGQGGMGHVYQVRDTVSNSIYALKTLVPEEGKNVKAIARFQKEFSAMKELDHPNIVRAFEFYQQGEELLGFTMEFVKGSDLDTLIYKNNISLKIEEKIGLLEQIAEGLSYAHDHDIVHRDLKPANILIEKSADNNLISKITDFGLAQQESDGADMSQSSNRIGTAYYMSPEQHRGEELNSRTDIYSFGILAFELLTAKRPFDGNTPFKLFLAHVSQGIPDIRKINSDIPKWLANMVEICSEKKPEHRYRTMKEVLSLIRSKKDRKEASRNIFSIFK